MINSYKNRIIILTGFILTITLILFPFFFGCSAGTVVEDITDVQDIEQEGMEKNNSEVIVTEEGSKEEETGELTQILMDKSIIEYIETLDLDAGEFLELSQQDKAYLVDLTSQAVLGYISGNPIEEKVSHPSQYDGIEYEVHIILRVDGRVAGWDFACNSNLAESVYNAAINTMKDQTTDINTIKDNLWKLSIEIIIKGDDGLLDDGFERGIHGIAIYKGEKRAIALSPLSVEGNISMESIINSLYAELGLEESSNYEDVNIYYFPTIHFARTTYKDEVATLYRCSETELVPDLTPEKIFETTRLAEGWMLLNIDEDGYFNYGYSPSREEYLTTNNMIRQFLSSRWLADKSNSNPDLLYLHKINLDYILRNWYIQEGDLGYIYFGEKSKLGAMAMAISTIARSPLYEDYKIYAEKLANTVLSMQHDDGSFDAWFIEPDYEYDEDSLLRFYSGEGILGMLELYEASREEKYLEAIKLSQDYYIDRICRSYRGVIIHLHMVPWQTMSLSKLYKITGDRKYIEPYLYLTTAL